MVPAVDLEVALVKFSGPKRYPVSIISHPKCFGQRST